MLKLYRVESLSNDFGFPVAFDVALSQVANRLPKLDDNDVLRIRRVDYELDPEEPPTIETKPLRKVWRETILAFPKIGSLGTYACKPSSQHRYGNAQDWAAEKNANDSAKIIAYLDEVADWSRNQGVRFTKSDGQDGLPISEVIWRDRISTRKYDWTWRPYGGVMHASHVHVSAYPLIDTDRACGAI
jgi:hypothetical protein